MRRVRFFQPDGCVSIDFLAQSASIFRRTGEDGGKPLVESEELKLDPEDALLAQLRAFLDAVSLRSIAPASGNGALGALRTALRVVEAMPRVADLR